MNDAPLISVVIVDDHKIIADGLARLIEDSEVARIIGKVHSATECQNLLKYEQPDVLMLDIGLPDANGIDLCVKIKEQYPQIKVLILTSYGELTTIARALDVGADGYVLKNSMQEELIEGIRTVASGKRFLCEEAGMAFKDKKRNQVELTRREMELLQLIVEGYTLPELANKMYLGYQTIRSYRKNLNVKLDAHNTAQLIQKAKELGLV